MQSETAVTRAADLDLPGPAEYAIEIGFTDFRTFLKDFSANLALDGMFVAAAEPQPPGAEVACDLTLGDGHPLIKGRGLVAWSRSGRGKAEPAGMGIRFLDLDPKSERLVRRIVEERTKAGLAVFDLGQALSAAEAETEPALRRETDTGEIESLRAEIEKLKREQTEEQALWQADLEAAREAESDLASRLSESLSRVVTISEARDALVNELHFEEESRRRDRQQLEKFEAERAAATRATAEQKAEVARWSEEAVAASTERENLESEKRSLEEKIEAERARAVKLAAEVEDARADVAAQQTANESLNKELRETRAALDKAATGAEANETALRERLEQACAELEESASSAAELEQGVEGLRAELGKIQQRSEAFQAETESIRTELERLRSRHDEIRTQAAMRQEAAGRAEKLVERVRAEHASLQDDLAAALNALGEVAEANELTENVPDASGLKASLAGLAQRPLGNRGAERASDQFLHDPASESTVSRYESEVELPAGESQLAKAQRPERV